MLTRVDWIRRDGCRRDEDHGAPIGAPSPLLVGLRWSAAVSVALLCSLASFRLVSFPVALRLWSPEGNEGSEGNEGKEGNLAELRTFVRPKSAI